MSYHLYSTEGIILSSNLAGESNRFYNIYTKDLGLVGVWGQGVRKLESKLRFNLQDFSHVKVHLVRGKNMWRLTDVEKIDDFPRILSSEKKRLLIGRIVSLMKRLLEEGSDFVLYKFFIATLEYLETENIDSSQLKSFEVIFVLRILEHLGYGVDSIPKNISQSYLWGDDVISLVKKQHEEFVRIANESLQQTNM